MFIQVKLINGYPQPLWYKVPPNWKTTSLLGKIVRVPLRNKAVEAVVINQAIEKPKYCSFTIKPAQAIEPFPADHKYNTYLNRLAYYYQTPNIYFLKRLQQFLIQNKKNSSLDFVTTQESQDTQTILLTNEQQHVVNFLTPKIIDPVYCPTLLHGVTGSGKTEVYKRAIMIAHQQKKTSILMLPEITLAIQFTHILQQQLPNHIPIFSFHSGTSAKQKRLLWQALIKKEPMVILGVHLPILLPIANLGLIIVDEEHETGYQEKKHPKIHSKEAALIRAQLYNIPILMGSATPSLSSLYNVKQKGWHFFQLKKRFAGAFPTIKIVPLTKNTERRNFWISHELYTQIKDRLLKKEQTIIFLNRRGYSFFVQCKQCSFIFECSSCSVSLTLHQNNIITCHYCGFSKQLPNTCPSCKADEKQLLKKGIGTQQVVTILQKLFPHAVIARADMDITSKKKVWRQTVEEFLHQKIDILIGTQSITKGFHFPHVTLVGILWADLNLHFPIYNATETTLQQLIQVAGRAGRKKLQSAVIIQTMQEHPVFSNVNELDYLSFYTQELETRKLVQYPPVIKLAEIELKYTNEVILDAEAKIIRKKLYGHCNNCIVLGPAKPPVYKIKKIHIRKLYIKAPHINHLIALFQKIDLKHYKSSIYFTPNPQQ